MVVETQYYDLLAVGTSASTDEICKSYKRLALKFHPDKTNHDPQLTETFKDMTRAYEVLRNGETREVYDKYGEAGLDGSYNDTSANAPRSGARPRNERPYRQYCPSVLFSQMFSEFSDIIQGNSSFSQLKMNPFGNFKFSSSNENTMSSPVNVEVFPGSPNRNQEFVRGQDIHHICNMTLADLYYGKTLKLQLPRYCKCAVCNGIAGLNPKTCRTCEGNGNVVINHYSEFSKFQQVGTCESCNGTGIFVAPQDKCLSCNACGYTKEKKLLKVAVLPGTKHDDKIILHGEGDEGRNIIPGDVIIHIKEIQHPYLIRKYHDLYMEYDIDLKTALLGGEIYIDNFLREKQSLKLHINVHGNSALNSEVVQSGEILGTINPGEPKIVRGFGMPINEAVLGGEYTQNLDEVDDLLDVCFDLNRYQRGNLFINFNIKLPSLNEMSEQGLFQLQSILPDTITVPPKNHNILEGYLANITDNNKEGRGSSNAPVMDSESDTETFNYNDIDINDSVEVEEEDEQFYDKEWDAELRKRRRL